MESRLILKVGANFIMNIRKLKLIALVRNIMIYINIYDFMPFSGNILLQFLTRSELSILTLNNI